MFGVTPHMPELEVVGADVAAVVGAGVGAVVTGLVVAPVGGAFVVGEGVTTEGMTEDVGAGVGLNETCEGGVLVGLAVA